MSSYESECGDERGEESYDENKEDSEFSYDSYDENKEDSMSTIGLSLGLSITGIYSNVDYGSFAIFNCYYCNEDNKIEDAMKQQDGNYVCGFCVTPECDETNDCD
jgi:hypothetical protein